MTHPDDCCCPSLADAVRAQFEERELPRCPVHDSDPGVPAGQPMALNDDAGLKAAIAHALGAPTTTADSTTPLDAV